MDRLPTPHRGVTLLELIIVIGLLLILAALLVPAVQKVRQAAARTQSSNNLKQLGIGYHNYNDAYKKLPPIAGKAPLGEGSNLFHLLPFLEQDNLRQQAKGNSWNVANAVIPIFLDPQDNSAPNHLHENSFATTNYAGNWLGFKDGANRIPASFPDGTSNTMMFATRYQLCNGTPTAWAYPTIYTWTPMFGYYSYAKFQVNPKQADCDPHVPQSIGTVMLIGLCDASVRTVDASISPRTWWLLTDPADGNPLDSDF